MAVPVVNKSLFIVGHGPPVLASGGQSAKLGGQLAGGLGRGATWQSLRVGVDGAALQRSSLADRVLPRTAAPGSGCDIEFWVQVYYA